MRIKGQYKSIEVKQGCTTIEAEVYHRVPGKQARLKVYSLQSDGLAERTLMHYIQFGSRVEFDDGEIILCKGYDSRQVSR